MKKIKLSIVLLFIASCAYGQVGIGTIKPHKSALLDVEAPANKFGGILIPQIPLHDTTDSSLINNGQIANSLLVFNTTANKEVTPGYYYWFTDKWIRLVSDLDDFVSKGIKNEALAVDPINKVLFIKDSVGKIVSVPLDDLNLETVLKSNGKGVFKYVNEKGVETEIDIPTSIITNINTITANSGVQNAIFNAVLVNAKSVSGDSIINVNGGANAVLKPIQVTLNDYSITNQKLIANPTEQGKILKVNAEGKIYYAALPDENSAVTKFYVDNASRKLKIVDSTNKEFSVDLSDINITTRLIQNGNGRYTHINETGNPLTIDVVKDVIVNIDSITNNTAVQKSIFEVVANDGKNLSSTDHSISVTQGSKAVLTDTWIDIAPLGVTTAKLANNAVTTTKINNLAITNDKIANNAITSDKIVNSAVVSSKIAMGNVKTEHIALKTVTAALLNAENAQDSSVATADGQGNVVYKPIQSFFDARTKQLSVNGPISVSGKSSSAVLEQITLSIIPKGITSEYLGDTSVTQEKLKAPETSAPGDVLAVQKDNTVKYQSFKESVLTHAGDMTSSDETISITNTDGTKGGAKTVSNPVNLSLNANAVSTDKIKNRAVTEEKLFAGQGKENFIAVAKGDGGVLFQPLESVYKNATLTLDNSLEASGDLNKALRTPISLKVKNNGILNKHIEHNAITADKISSKVDSITMEFGALLRADGNGNASFVNGEDAIRSIMVGDLVGDSESISVLNGTDILFGKVNKQTSITIVTGGIKDKHLSGGSVTNTKIATDAISTDKIKEKAVTPNKIFAEVGDQDRVAITDSLGNVTFKKLNPNYINAKGKIYTDGIIKVDNGEGKTLSDVTFELANNAVTTNKLKSNGSTSNSFASPGSVATADGIGNVAYKPITSSFISDSQNLTTDGIIIINGGGNNNMLSNTVLKETVLSIADKSISTAKLADTIITTSKVANKAINIEKLGNSDNIAGKILITDNNGGFKFSTISAEANVGKDLTTDSIIGFSDSNAGKNAVFIATGLKINDNSIKINKLNSKAQPKDMLMVTNGDGGFDYVIKEAVQAGGVDMKLGSSLEFINGTTGLNSVFARTDIDVKNKGITTSKIADLAVDISKMNSTVANANKPKGQVLAADGSGNVQFENVGDLIVEHGKDLTSDGSLAIAANNKALLKGISIGIATQGVQTAHIADASVNIRKMNSIIDQSNVPNESVLIANGSGGVAFTTIKDVVFDRGQPLTADGPLVVSTGSKALLEAANIKIKPLGITNNYIGPNAVTTDKIGSTNISADFVLVADGDGGTVFKNATKIKFETGKILKSGGTLTVTGGENAVLENVKIDISPLGVTNEKIANKTIQASKINSLQSAAGTVLSSLGDGEVQFLPLNTYGSKLSPKDSSLVITGGDKAVLSPTSIEINTGGVLTKHIGNSQVTTAKISSAKTSGNELANSVLTADGSGGVSYKSFDNLAAKGNLNSTGSLLVSDGTNALLKNVSIDINNLGIKEKHIDNKAISIGKLSSEGFAANFVGVTDGNSGVEYKSVTELITNNTSNLSLVGALEFGDGTDGIKAVRQPVTIKVRALGITESLIAANAVTATKLATNSVTTDKLEVAAVTTEKIAKQAITSEKINSDGATAGSILIANGDSTADFKVLKSMMPKFFYLPSIALELAPGTTKTKNLYTEYTEQFGNPKISNPSSNKKLPVLPVSELNYYITYYDATVFTNVSISDQGVLTYSIASTAKITGASYMNIVIEVK